MASSWAWVTAGLVGGWLAGIAVEGAAPYIPLRSWVGQRQEVERFLLLVHVDKATARARARAQAQAHAQAR